MLQTGTRLQVPTPQSAKDVLAANRAAAQTWHEVHEDSTIKKEVTRGTRATRHAAATPPTAPSTPSMPHAAHRRGRTRRHA